MRELETLLVAGTPTPQQIRAVAEVLDGRPLLPTERDDLPTAPAAEDVVLGVATSGSTGTPRVVLHTVDSLRASVDATHARIGGPGQWVLALGIAHIAGIQVVLRATVGGTTPVVCAAGGPDFVPAFTAATADLGAGRRYVSLVPTQLRRLLDAGADLTAYDAVLLGGAAADPRLLAESRAAGVPVVTTYGMSETAGGCVYDGVPLDGVTVDAPTDRVGPVTLRGPVVARGYLGGPAFDGVFATADTGWWRDGRLEVVGRTDGLISTGAERVAPSRVEAALLADPSVRAAAVVGVPDREWGEVVAAVVVTDADPDAVRARVRRRLAAYEVPKRVVAVPDLPRVGALGKTDYPAVRRLLTP